MRWLILLALGMFVLGGCASMKPSANQPDTINQWQTQEMVGF